MQSSAQRDCELQFLEAATLADSSSPDFDILLETFGLPQAYKETLVSVLRLRKWEKSTSPFVTVKRAVTRAAFKVDEAGKNRRKEKSYAGDLGRLAYIRETSEALRGKDGIWRCGGGREEIREECRLNVSEYFVRKLPPRLRETYHPKWSADPQERPKWEAIARHLGWDEWEAYALQLVGNGVSIYSVFELLKDDVERRALSAAWKRLQRSKLQELKTLVQ